MPPPLPRKPRSLSTSIPPPLPPRNHLNAKLIAEKRLKKGLTKTSAETTTKTKIIKPAIRVRSSSSPHTIPIKPAPLISSYNKDLFLTSTTRVQCRVRAKTLLDLPSDDPPLIPQPPLEFVSLTLKQQQKFDPSFEKLRTLQAIEVLSILQFHPAIIAYQLTLIESAIFRNIALQALKNHKPKSPETSILTSIDFFNYLTRLIEHGVLTKINSSDRARHLNYWIKVANKCHELKNYQTLKAVISALKTPPMQRLKQSWTFVPKKSMQLLEDMTELMSESCNYEKYRQVILDFKQTEPIVPFLGLFIHDMTYLCALKEQQGTRELELTTLFKDMQGTPQYSLLLPANFTKEISPKFSLRAAATAVRKGSQEDEHTKLSIDMQQCLVTQYLLTRPWVSEKEVDELCLLREPTKPNGATLTTSTSLTTTRSSAGSLTSNSTSTSRPLSLKDDEEEYFDKRPGFWLFGRKSVDHHTALKSVDSFATLHRSPRHFSFDEIKDEELRAKKGHYGTVASQHSLTIFRKEFWKNNHSTTHKLAMGSFNSDPSLSTRNTSSHPLDKPDDSTSFIWT